MDNPQLLIENSKRLKKFFSPFNPLLGDHEDSERFLFKVNGLKKAYLPIPMKSIPLIQKLMAAGSISKFKRSHFFRSDFHSISQLHTSLNNLRLKYDFSYWIYHNFPSQIPFKEYRTLLTSLQSLRWSGAPLRIIIRKNCLQDISAILFLFILWFKDYATPNSNVMVVAPSSSDSRSFKDFFLGLKENSTSISSKFKKTDTSSALYQPSNKSKFWFTSASDPDRCRSLDFAFLILKDTDKWKNSGESSLEKTIRATFPVVTANKDSAIILECGPLKRTRFLRKEILDAVQNISGFKFLSVPWYDSPSNMYRFDFPEERITFYNNLIKYRKRRTFPHFPMADERYLYYLWDKGLPLESIYWYAAESSFYESSAKFQNLYPPVP